MPIAGFLQEGSLDYPLFRRHTGEHMSQNPTISDKNSPEEILQPAVKKEEKPKEIGGPEGLEPTRYGDWEKNGRCTDF